MIIRSSKTEIKGMLKHAENYPYLRVGLKNDEKYKLEREERIKELKRLIKIGVD